MSENELAEQRIERESVDAGADRKDQHRRGAVNSVTGANLATARLQEISNRSGGTWIRCTQDRKDAADRHIDVDVR